MHQRSNVRHHRHFAKERLHVDEAGVEAKLLLGVKGDQRRGV